MRVWQQLHGFPMEESGLLDRDKVVMGIGTNLPKPMQYRYLRDTSCLAREFFICNITRTIMRQGR
jgi:hypothetical protein